MALSRFVLPFADVGSGIRPSSNAKLFFYDTGTNNAKSTFNSAAGDTANSNPVIADTRGVFPDIFVSGIYKVVLQDSSGNQIWEADPVASPSTDIQAIARSLNVVDSAVILSTDTVTLLDNVSYIYDATAQTAWGVPTLDSTGKTIVSVVGSALTTTGGTGSNSYTLVNVYAVTAFSDVDELVNAKNLEAGTKVSTGGTVWNIQDSSGLSAGTYIALQNSLAAIQETEVYVDDFGIRPENTAVENSDAWDVMWTLLPDLVSGGSLVSVGTLKWRSGVYQFDRRWELKKQAEFIGQGSGQAGVLRTTVFEFTGNDADAVTVNRSNTLNGGKEVTPTTGADGTLFKGVAFYTANRVSGKNGVWLRARAKFVDCQVDGFGGWGIRIVANAVTGDDTVLGNANNWEMNTVVITNNGTPGVSGGGLYIDGGDVNIGHAVKLDSSSNYGRGVFDSSFLGNTYTACHFASNGKAIGDDSSQVSHSGNRYYLVDETAGIGASTTPGTNNDIWRLYGAGGVSGTYPAWVNTANYSVGYAVHTDDSNARNEFFGCYTEGGQPRVLLQAPDKVYGGIMSGGGAGFDEDSNAFVIAATTAGVGELSPILVKGDGTTVGYGSSLTGQYALGLFEDAGNANGITLQNTGGAWGWSYANGVVTHGIYTDTTAETAGRSVTVTANRPFFSQAVMGFGSTLRHFGRADWTTGTAFPTSGEFAKGDAFLFSGAGAGGKIGVICTTSGTAGSTAVFKYFGAIDA